MSVVIVVGRESVVDVVDVGVVVVVVSVVISDDVSVEVVVSVVFYNGSVYSY